MSGDGTPAVSAEGLSKSFGSTRALQEVDLALLPGEVHALAGENGAGKSTFVKILAGATPPDAGRLLIQGTPARFVRVGDALEHGVVPIYQHLSLMPHLTVLENLTAFSLSQGSPWSRRPRRRGMEAQARLALRQVGLDLPLHRTVAGLTLAERQLIEIARGLLRQGILLVLDEPTAALNRAEASQLFAVVRALRERGWAVLFISHRLEEIEEIADRVSVLRDGRIILGGVGAAQLSRRQIVEALETHYNELVGELGITPRDSISVSLYTNQAYFDVTQAPAWSAALNDGKLRIPVEGLTGITSSLSQVLKHELAHSFIREITRNRCPAWLNEGIAQEVEARSTSSYGSRLARLYAAQRQVPLSALEGGWTNLSSAEASLAYAEGLAAVEYIRDTYGMSDVTRILKRLGEGAIASRSSARAMWAPRR